MPRSIPLSPLAAAEFGARVADMRRALDMTQIDLAEESGIDRSYIGQIEMGYRNPTLGAVLLLAAVLAVDPAELVGGLHLL